VAPDHTGPNRAPPDLIEYATPVYRTQNIFLDLDVKIVSKFASMFFSEIAVGNMSDIAILMTFRVIYYHVKSLFRMV